MFGLEDPLLLVSTAAVTQQQLTEFPREVPVINDLAHQRYNISVAIGTPPQRFDLLLDTASTDIWVPLSNSSGCSPNCPAGFEVEASSSIVNLSIPFDARYGLTPDLAVLGSYYNDTISVADLPSLPNAQFAVGNVPTPLFTQGNWGIFGLGSRLAEAVYAGPTSPFRGNLSATYTPLWERLSSSASGTRKYSVWLNSQSAKEGTVQFGGENSEKCDGELHSLPLNLEDDGNFRDWSVNLTGVVRVTEEAGEDILTRLTGQDYSLDLTIDTGSPNMYVPSALYESIVDGLNATEIINGAPYVSCSFRSASTGFLDFEFQTRTDTAEGSKVRIRVPYSEIIYPLGLPVTVPPVTAPDGSEMCYFGVVPTDGPVRLLGATFTRSAYVVFDADKLEVRMAQSRWTE